MELIITGCLPSWRAPRGVSGVEGRAESMTGRPRGGILEWQWGEGHLSTTNRCILHPQRARETQTGTWVFLQPIQTDETICLPPRPQRAHTLSRGRAVRLTTLAARSPAFPAHFVLKPGGTPGLPRPHSPIRGQDPVFLNTDAIQRDEALAM